MKGRRRQRRTTPEAVPCRPPLDKLGMALSMAEGPPDHLRDEWAKLSPEERLHHTLRLHRLRRELLKLKK